MIDEIKNKAEEIRSAQVETVETVEETPDVVEDVVEEVAAEEPTNTTETDEERAAVEEVETPETAAAPTVIRNMKDNFESAAQRYSLGKAVKEAATTGTLTGLEAEMNQEARAQAAASGLNITGHVAVPAEMRADASSMTVSAGGTQTNNDIFDDGQGIVKNFRAEGVVDRLGVSRMTGLSGDVVIPIQSANITADNTLTEIEDLDLTNIALTQKRLTPQRVGAGTSYSKQLLAQNQDALDAFLMADLGKSMSLAVDNYVLAQLFAAITEVDGTDISAEEVPFLMEQALLDANVPADGAKFLVTPGVNRQFRRAPLDAGSGMFASDRNDMIGYGNVRSTLVTAKTAYFGDFSEIVVAEWGGLDLIVDPYTGAQTNVVKIIANQHLDAIVRRASAIVGYNNIGEVSA